jgi:hypothetical protein
VCVYVSTIVCMSNMSMCALSSICMHCVAQEHALALAHLHEEWAATKLEWQRQRIEMEDQARDELRRTTSSFEATQEAQAAAFAQAMENAERQMKQANAAVNEQWHIEKQRWEDTLQAETLFHERERDRLLAELAAKKDSEMADALQTLGRAHEGAIHVLEGTIDTCHEQIRILENDIEYQKKQVQQGKACLDAKQDEWTARVERMEVEQAQTVEALKKDHKRELEHMVDEHWRETRDLKDQFDKTRALLLEQQQTLVQKIREWENVYARRDSRMEDLDRIEDLERLVVEKDALVQQTMEEMAYFKRELLNREETYNKTFGRSPNVGVLQVLKPTGVHPGIAGPTKASRKTKPQSKDANHNNSKPLPPISSSSNNNQHPSFRDLSPA